MELKKHFKLYKSGKLWCTVAVVLAGTILGVGSVQADSTLDNSNVEVQQSVTNTSNENVIDNTESTSNSTIGNDNKGAVPVTPAAQSTDTSEQNITETGQPNSFKTVDNKVYYYGNDGKEYKNQFYIRTNSIITGATPTTLELMVRVIPTNSIPIGVGLIILELTGRVGMISL